jgi:ring-1,2-phenylacetyl-CoA epoxidase subunit PaaE
LGYDPNKGAAFALILQPQNMDTHFYPLRVKQLVRETTDAVTVVLEIPADLKPRFQYTAGQYLNFRIDTADGEIRRSYSLCTGPETDEDLAVTVKKVDNGRMSTWMNEVLKEGDTIEVMPPMGKFTVHPEPGRSHRYVLFGGGSGITPLMGIAKTVLHSEPGSTVFLVYANRNPDQVIFKKQWAALEQQYGGRLKVFLSYDQAPFTWFGLKGVLTPDKVQQIISSKIGGDNPNQDYFICGPTPMMDVVKQGLQRSGADASRIHIEYFTAPSADKEEAATAVGTASEDETPFHGTAHVKVTVYGRTSDISVKENTSILDAAIKANLEPPYSCTVGVCTTCRARVVKGKVEMREREGLSDEEIAQGFVLTCQSYCRSADVELVYE